MMADRRCLVKFAGVFCLVTLVSALAAAPAVYALGLENVKVWKGTGEAQCYASAVGDVDDDGSVEIVTGGEYWDGSHVLAQLCVWNGSTLTLENVATWYWIGSAHIWSVAVGDVDDDGSVEIVTGGYYWDPAGHEVAQLCVWDGSTLTLENVAAWYWTTYTEIRSVAVGDVDDDGSVEIVTGGFDEDGDCSYAQLCVWDGSTLTLENVAAWYWSSYTLIESVAVGDVDDDGSVEIVTGGSYYNDDDGRDVAQLCVWDGSTLTLENVAAWYWTSHTRIYSVAVGDVDDDGSVEIVTGGHYQSGTRRNAQLCVWSGSTLTLENVAVWYWTSDTGIYSVAVGDVDDDGSVEIVTGGYYWDFARDVAQLCVWDGSTLTLENVAVWYWTSHTYIWSIAVGDVDSDDSAEIVTGGYYEDTENEYNAQLTVWTSAMHACNSC